MKKIIGIALLAGGIVLLVYGFRARDSIESKLTETFTGTLSDNARNLLVAGAASTVAGVALILLRNKS